PDTASPRSSAPTRSLRFRLARPRGAPADRFPRHGLASEAHSRAAGREVCLACLPHSAGRREDLAVPGHAGRAGAPLGPTLLRMAAGAGLRRVGRQAGLWLLAMVAVLLGRGIAMPEKSWDSRLGR